MIYKYMIY